MFGMEDDGLLAEGVRLKGCEAGVEGGSIFFQGAGFFDDFVVVEGVAELLLEVVEAVFALLAGVGIVVVGLGGFILGLGGGYVVGDIDMKGDFVGEDELSGNPAVELDDAALTGDEAGGGMSKGCEDAVGASDGDEVALGMEGGAREKLGLELGGVGAVLGFAKAADFVEAEDGAGVDHAGPEVEAFEVDLLG